MGTKLAQDLQAPDKVSHSQPTRVASMMEERPSNGKRAHGGDASNDGPKAAKKQKSGGSVQGGSYCGPAMAKKQKPEGSVQPKQDYSFMRSVARGKTTTTTATAIGNTPKAPAVVVNQPRQLPGSLAKTDKTPQTVLQSPKNVYVGRKHPISPRNGAIGQQTEEAEKSERRHVRASAPDRDPADVTRDFRLEMQELVDDLDGDVQKIVRSLRKKNEETIVKAKRSQDDANKAQATANIAYEAELTQLKGQLEKSEAERERQCVQLMELTDKLALLEGTAQLSDAGTERIAEAVVEKMQSRFVVVGSEEGPRERRPTSEANDASGLTASDVQRIQLVKEEGEDEQKLKVEEIAEQLPSSQSMLLA
ncbi:hypothetical protein MBLNU230_g6507t1 [Neophaeotheca triangularis]